MQPISTRSPAVSLGRIRPPTDMATSGHHHNTIQLRHSRPRAKRLYTIPSHVMIQDFVCLILPYEPDPWMSKANLHQVVQLAVHPPLLPCKPLPQDGRIILRRFAVVILLRRLRSTSMRRKTSLKMILKSTSMHQERNARENPALPRSLTLCHPTLLSRNINSLTTSVFQPWKTHWFFYHSHPPRCARKLPK